MPSNEQACKWFTRWWKRDAPALCVIDRALPFFTQTARVNNPPNERGWSQSLVNIWRWWRRHTWQLLATRVVSALFRVACIPLIANEFTDSATNGYDSVSLWAGKELAMGAKRYSHVTKRQCVWYLAAIASRCFSNRSHWTVTQLQTEVSCRSRICRVWISARWENQIK